MNKHNSDLETLRGGGYIEDYDISGFKERCTIFAVIYNRHIRTSNETIGIRRSR